MRTGPFWVIVASLLMVALAVALSVTVPMRFFFSPVQHILGLVFLVSAAVYCVQSLPRIRQSTKSKSPRSLLAGIVIIGISVAWFVLFPVLQPQANSVAASLWMIVFIGGLAAGAILVGLWFSGGK